VVPDHPLLSDSEASLRYSGKYAGRQAQVVSRWNAQPLVKRGWRLIGEVFKYSWAYQLFIFGLTFGLWATFYFPTLYVYQANNAHRTFAAAIAKEKAHKRKLREAEAAAEAAEAGETAQE
jgi:hypothetical protein